MATSSTAKPRRSKAEQREESRTQILDAAEYLFSKRGLYGVTLKDVAERVGFHTSLLHYYFDDKRTLFDAVISRRAPLTAERRMKSMDDYERAAGGHPTVEGAMHAYLDPDLELYITGGEGLRNYAGLGAQIANTEEGAEVLDTHFDKVVLRLIDLLRKAMPGCADEDLFWGYHFVTGSLMHTFAQTSRIHTLSGGLCRSDDYAAVKERMATFMAGGFEAVCRARRQARAANSESA